MKCTRDSHLKIVIKAIHVCVLFDWMQRDGSMNFSSFQWSSECSTAAGRMMENVLHLLRVEGKVIQAKYKKAGVTTDVVVFECRWLGSLQKKI